MIELGRYKEAIRKASSPHFRGQIEEVTGVIVEADGVPAAMGELCRIERGETGSIEAEVVGFRGARTLLMPHGELQGISPGQAVYALGRPFTIRVSDELLGRIVDGYGKPLDGGMELLHADTRPVRSEAPAPLDRIPIDEPLQTGVRAVDGLMTVGRGQRLGIFAGSGVGKSTLLGQMTRGTDADVVVCCLVGERGREVQDFLNEVLGEEGRKRAVVVVATSDRPPIERFSAPFVATTIAEHFRDQGLNVLFLMDSVTRFAAASREIGLAAGEPPTVRGYPPSFFANVPKLVERLGKTAKGSITGMLTVLLEGDDPDEPVADTMRGLLDGHLLLSRAIASAGRYPAIDVQNSLSRLMPVLVDPSHEGWARELRGLLAAHADGKDLIDIGAYRPGANARLDRAVLLMPAIEAFLGQATSDLTRIEDTREMLQTISEADTSGGER